MNSSLDPDLFRETHNGSRWYIDPLNDDNKWEQTFDRFPSVSLVKSASGTDWSDIALRRVATAIDTLAPRLDQIAWPARYALMKTINSDGLKGAGQRGTNVHEIIDAALTERLDLLGDNAPGANYRQSINTFLTDYQPTAIATEFVIINRQLNGVGYGGTCDALIKIGKKQFIVDWKSRGETSPHGAYLIEAAQLAAYANADYMIVNTDNGPQRQPIPHIDGALIVSIKPDGVAMYPIDLTAAHRYWTALHTWHCEQLNTPNPIRSVWQPKKIVLATTDTLGTSEPTAVVASTPTKQRATRKPALSPSQGVNVDEHQRELLRIKYKKLDPARQQWVHHLITESDRFDVTFALALRPTARSFELSQAVINIAKTPDDQLDLSDATIAEQLSELARSILAGQLGDTAFTGNLAQTIGNLDIDGAWTFANNVSHILKPNQLNP